MSERFYKPGCRAGEHVFLEGDEATHLTRVMRAKVGDLVVLFDGEGREFDAEITENHGKKVCLKVGDAREITRMGAHEVIIASAVPKGHRMDHLVELCSAFGVSRLIPMDTARSVASAVEAGPSKRARWDRITVEIAKQCGRNVLMRITPKSFADVLSDPEMGRMKLLATTAGDAQPVRGVLPAKESMTALVGPEGGFTPEEVAAALQAGYRPVSLGKAILRIEHAVGAIAAIMSCE